MILTCFLACLAQAVKERKKHEALARHRSVILSYKPYDRIKIRSKSGMIYEVPLISISSERETVSVYWLECVLRVIFAVSRAQR